MFLFESLAGNDFSERGTQAEAHCERNLNSANCEVLEEKHRMIDVQGIFVRGHLTSIFGKYLFGRRFEI